MEDLVVLVLFIVTFWILLPFLPSLLFPLKSEYPAITTSAYDLELEPLNDLPAPTDPPSTEFSLIQLRVYNGVSKPQIYLAINNWIFDVSKSVTYYGPDGPYSGFAGRDVTLKLVRHSPSDFVDGTSDIEGIEPPQFTNTELDILRDWLLFFINKYPCVGQLKAQ